MEPLPKSQAASKPIDSVHKPESKSLKGEDDWCVYSSAWTQRDNFIPFSWARTTNMSVGHILPICTDTYVFSGFWGSTHFHLSLCNCCL